VERWHKKGLLLIGDAARVMSPIGGIGINLAMRRRGGREQRVGTLSRDALKGRTSPGAAQGGLEVRLIQGRRLSRTRRTKTRTRSTTRSSVPKLSGIRFFYPLVRDLPVKLLAFGLVPETAYLPSVGPKQSSVKRVAGA